MFALANAYTRCHIGAVTKEQHMRTFNIILFCILVLVSMIMASPFMAFVLFLIFTK